MSRSTFHSEGDLAMAYDQYADALFRHCYFRTFDREQGKQLMLQTFRDTWQFIAEGNYIDDMRMFLYRKANDLIARARTITSPATGATVSQDAVLITLSHVPAEDRDAFILRHIDGLEPQAIADILGEPADVLMQRADRGSRRIALLSR